MLSVRRRDEGRKEVGLRFGGMEENELEEGEACSGQEEEDDSCVDPDIALSYIDEKLQDVLGHFQKDFEDGVSAENLGAKFGGYGSFLPTYQRSPSILSQPKSPPRAPNHNATRSPYAPSFEGSCQNSSIKTGTSLSKNNTALTTPLDNSNKKDMVKRMQNDEEPIPHDLLNKPVNGSDQKTLKVRIKVCPDNILARNNAAIYSGLGLDMSPSSSLEDSPDGSGGLSPDSPRTILQMMTCSPVPGVVLLSPLRDSLFHLTGKVSSFIKNCKTGNDIPDKCAVLGSLTVPVKDIKGYNEKKMRIDEKKEKSMEVKKLKYEDDISAILNREIDIETPAGQDLVSDALNISLLSGSENVDRKAERQIVRESVKGVTMVLDHLKEPEKITMKERIPLSDIVKAKQLESTESTEHNGIGKLENKVTYSKENLNSETTVTEKALEEQITSSHKGTFDSQGEDGSKAEKSYDLDNGNSNIFKGMKEHMAGLANPVKHISSQKVTSCEQGEKIFQGKDQLVEGKRKLKGSQTDVTPLVELSKDNLSGHSSTSLKEKKKNSDAKSNHSEKKSKVSKSRKELSKGSFKESCGDVFGDLNPKQLENGTSLPDVHFKDKLKILKYEPEKQPFTPIETPKARSGGKKVDNAPISDLAIKEPTTIPLMGNASASVAAAATHAPVVINEHWVCCDICQQWRLLPYGTNPDHLPKNWQCNLLDWLPGMNSCNFSEEQTTRALNELYLIPVPEIGASLEGQHNVSASGITSINALHVNPIIEHNMQSLAPLGKRKNGPKKASNIPQSIQFSNPEKRNQQASNRSGSLNDVNQYPFETSLSDKVGLSHAGKSTDFNAEKQKFKQKEKHKNRGCFSNGGDFIETSKKHLKPKSKREVDQNDFRAFKKIKNEGSHYSVEDCYSDHDLAGKGGPDMADGLTTKVIAKNHQKLRDISLSKDLKCETKGSSSVSSQRLKDEIQFHPNGETKEQISVSDVEKSEKLELASKKRQQKEWQDDLHNQEVQAAINEVLSEPEMLKKAKISKSEGKVSSTGKMDKKGSSTRIVLPASREHLSDGMDEEGRYAIGKEHQLGLSQGNATSRPALDFVDPLKRDVAYAQASTAATSSSSKVSSSRRSKANFQETKGSPVESVSSSPLRFSNTEKLSNRRNSVVKDDALNVGSSLLGSPRRCSDGEADGRSDRFGKRRKETTYSVQQRDIENHRAAESGVLNLTRGSFDHQDREASQLSCGKVGDRMHLKRLNDDDLSPIEFEEINVVSGSRILMDPHGKYPHEHPCKDHIEDLENLNKLHQVNGSAQRKSGNSFSSRFKERSRSSKSDLDKGKLKVSSLSSENKDSSSMKNGSRCQQKVDLSSHLHSTYLEDLGDGNYNFQKDEKDFPRKDLATRCSIGRRDNGMQEHLNIHGPSMLSNQHNDIDSRVAVVGTRCGKSNIQDDLQPVSSNNDEKPSDHIMSGLIDQRELTAGIRKAQSILSSGDKQETHSRGPQKVSSPVKGCRPELSSNDAVNVDASKAGKQSKQTNIQNGAHHNSLRQGTPNGLDSSSPIRKDSHSAASIVMKEARDLKHTANRLKGDGLALESTGLFFQAALKFLHYAYLMEPPNFDSAKQGDASRSMQIYFDTAKLCNFCAHEYEKCKEMAAAALAYKCVEVAYLKSAYYKYPNAIRDQHELQIALQILQPGESPSSSASDVDNLNNQGTLGKAISTRGVSSPQVAGTHVIAARNHPHVLRLLSYTNDLNCAFEATRKSQIAIAAASVSLGKDRAEGMSSVREVLDYNFHNIEELLRLVRLSMESIGR